MLSHIKMFLQFNRSNLRFLFWNLGRCVFVFLLKLWQFTFLSVTLTYEAIHFRFIRFAFSTDICFLFSLDLWHLKGHKLSFRPRPYINFFDYGTVGYSFHHSSIAEYKGSYMVTSYIFQRFSRLHHFIVELWQSKEGNCLHSILEL